MVGTATLGFGGIGAVRYGARLVVPPAVLVAMQRSRYCVAGATIRRARSVRTMLGTETTCLSTRAAAIHPTHFRSATAMLATLASCGYCCGAVVERADPFGAMLAADSASIDRFIATCSRADPTAAMFPAKPSSFSASAAAFSRASHFGFIRVGLGVRVVFRAHTLHMCCVSAALEGARSLPMHIAEPRW